MALIALALADPKPQWVSGVSPLWGAGWTAQTWNAAPAWNAAPWGGVAIL